MLVATWVVVGFFSAIGWWGANYYVITPYLPEPIFKESKATDKKEEPNIEKKD
jgi:hypothetical protein